MGCETKLFLTCSGLWGCVLCAELGIFPCFLQYILQNLRQVQICPSKLERSWMYLYLWHNQVSFLINFSWEGWDSQLALGEPVIVCQMMFSQERKDEGEQKEKVQTQSP